MVKEVIILKEINLGPSSHKWTFTSDSISSMARLSVVANMEQKILEIAEQHWNNYYPLYFIFVCIVLFFLLQVAKIIIFITTPTLQIRWSIFRISHGYHLSQFCFISLLPKKLKGEISQVFSAFCCFHRKMSDALVTW